MKHMPQVVAVMTPFPYSVEIDASVQSAQELMQHHRFRHLPVVEHGQLRGVLTDRDIRSALGHNLGFHNVAQLKVRDVFHGDAYTVDAATPLDRVATEMADRHVGSALVTKGGKLVGVFTTTDACRALAQVLRERFPPPSPGTNAA
ncbi:MAG: CBS domain-containing protein [Steroidobacteraceae bacterium]